MAENNKNMPERKHTDIDGTVLEPGQEMKDESPYAQVHKMRKVWPIIERNRRKMAEEGLRKKQKVREEFTAEKNKQLRPNKGSGLNTSKKAIAEKTTKILKLPETGSSRRNEISAERESIIRILQSKFQKGKAFSFEEARNIFPEDSNIITKLLDMTTLKPPLLYEVWLSNSQMGFSLKGPEKNESGT